jgi:hypothetical protein
MLRVSVPVAMAERVSLSQLRWRQGLGHQTELVALHGLWSSGLCHGGYDLSRHQKAATNVVPRHVVGNQSENGC